MLAAARLFVSWLAYGDFKPPGWGLPARDKDRMLPLATPGWWVFCSARLDCCCSLSWAGFSSDFFFLSPNLRPKNETILNERTGQTNDCL